MIESALNPRSCRDDAPNARAEWEREDEAGLRERLNNRVTITLTPHCGGTLLNLHHPVFQTVADRDDHRGGWTQRFERPADVLATRV